MPEDTSCSSMVNGLSPDVHEEHELAYLVVSDLVKILHIANHARRPWRFQWTNPSRTPSPSPSPSSTPPETERVLTSNRAAAALGVKLPTARKYLNALVAEGFASAAGNTRARKYTLVSQ